MPPPPKHKPKPAAPPVENAKTYNFEINRDGSGGHHWVLVGRQGERWWTVAGHEGPNPKTREAALAAIEQFRKTVAAAPVIEKPNKGVE